MKIPLLRAALPLLLLLPLACSEESPTDNYEPRRLQVPADYASIGAAAAAARAGDRIVVTADDDPNTFDFDEDVTLPPGVELLRHSSSPYLPSIRGSVTMNNSEAGMRIEGFEISNPEGNGIVLINSAASVTSCNVHDCQAAGLLMVGNSPAHVNGSDFANCEVGIKIQDVDFTGHHDDPEHPAAIINNCNLMGNYAEAGQDTFNLVFANVTKSYTVNVNLNYWGATPRDVPADNTIIDNKDDPFNLGLADTQNPNFLPSTDVINQWWY